MSKETRLNIRITPEFQDELKRIAAYHGLSLSSYVHSTLVRKLREERESTPEAFTSSSNGKIVGMITPGHRSTTKADVRHMLERDAELLEDVANKPRKVKHLGEITDKNAQKKRKTG